jgi:gliding motility-associated-like protein
MESLEACPIKLTGTLANDNNINLSWTAYTGYENGVNHYTIEKYTSGGTLLESTDVTETTYTDETADLNVQMYIYVVKAIPNMAGVSLSISNTISVIKDPNLFYPAAFTPNGDNLNDVFNVYGQYITDFEMDIYNRWGELMFTTTQLDIGWDGSFKGNAMPEGTYTFVANIKDLAGRTFKKSGTVLLLRKK